MTQWIDETSFSTIATSLASIQKSERELRNWVFTVMTSSYKSGMFVSSNAVLAKLLGKSTSHSGAGIIFKVQIASSFQYHFQRKTSEMVRKAKNIGILRPKQQVWSEVTMCAESRDDTCCDFPTFRKIPDAGDNRIRDCMYLQSMTERFCGWLSLWALQQLNYLRLAMIAIHSAAETF